MKLLVSAAWISLLALLSANGPSLSGIRLLTEQGGRVDWCRRLNRIAFDRAGPDGYFDVWTMNPDGSDQINLTGGRKGLPGKHNGNPVWHPSGEYIVFQSQKPQVPRWADTRCTPGAGALNDLWAITPDGKRVWKLYEVAYILSKDAPGVLHPQISHDGRQLLWSERLADNGRPFGAWAIKLADLRMTSNGPRLSNIRTFKPGRRSAFYETHSFSKDDKRFLFTGDQDLGLDIYEFDIGSQSVKRLTRNGLVWDEHAHYTPDGKHIIYMSNQDVQPPGWFMRKPSRLKAEFWIMRIDGSEPRRLTWFNSSGHPHFRGKQAIVAADSSWSPDGHSLAALLIDADPATRRRGQGQIVMIQFDKDNQR